VECLLATPPMPGRAVLEAAALQRLPRGAQLLSHVRAERVRGDQQGGAQHMRLLLGTDG